MKHQIVSKLGTIGTMAAAVALTLGIGTGVAVAQNNNGASSQDKQFLHDLGEDSNFEIASAKLALQKSQSKDVKEYAEMIIKDHTSLKQEIRSANQSVHTSAAPTSSMTTTDHARMIELKALSGESFDKAYIKELIKGNDEIQKEEKSEASDSTVEPVKKLAERAAEMDTKHSEKAKQLAQEHNVQS